MKVNKELRVLIIYVLVTVALCLATSCSSIRKLKSNIKQSAKVDSSYQQSAKVDSSGVSSYTKVDSSGFKVEVEFDKDTGNADIEIIVYPPDAKDYFQKVNVKSNKKLKGIKVEDTRKKVEAESKSADVKRSDNKKVDVKKEEKQTVKQVDKKKIAFHWWYFLGLIPIALFILYKSYPIPFKNILLKIIKPIK